MDKKILIILYAALIPQFILAQAEFVEVAETKEAYIRENHIEEIEDIVHEFSESKNFLSFLLEKGHNVDVENIKMKNKEVRIGQDIDVFVKHYSEHQNFTMLMIPVDFYKYAIYDTLLFAVLEVSDEWLLEKYPYHDMSNDSIKYALMELENHDILAEHMYNQGRKYQGIGMAETEVKLHESYISTNSIHLHTSDLDKDEKKEIRNHWSLLKKAFTHDITLNVEMNIYVFGYDDMDVVYYSRGTSNHFKITPRNIFTRHHFQDN